MSNSYQSTYWFLIFRDNFKPEHWMTAQYFFIAYEYRIVKTITRKKQMRRQVYTILEKGIMTLIGLKLTFLDLSGVI